MCSSLICNYINACYNEIYLQYVYYNLLVQFYLLSLVLCISLGTLHGAVSTALKQRRIYFREAKYKGDFTQV